MIKGRILRKYSLNEGHVTRAPLTKGIGWGLIGGLTGTLVMDGLLMVTFLALKLPALLCFSMVGDTVSQLFLKMNLIVVGGIPTGVAAHYLIGPLFGLLFGVIMVMFPTWRLITLKKTLLMAILYIEVFSQPILATTPIMLKMTKFEILQWYGGSFVMHLTMAVVLGAIMWYGMSHNPRANPNI